MSEAPSIITINCKSNDSYIDIRPKNANEFCFIEVPKESRNELYPKCFSTMTEVNILQGTSFTHPVWTVIIKQMKENFLNFHEKVANCDNDKNLSNLCLEASQIYLQIIENGFRELNESTFSDGDNEIKESLELIIKLWKLCEIIFIKSSPSGALLIDLQKWYKSTYNLNPLIESIFKEANRDQKSIVESDAYWDIIKIATLQGRVDVVSHFLSFNPKKNTSVFKSIDELIKKIPKFDSLEYTPTIEFKAKWEFWQKECLNVLRNEDFNDAPVLETICNIFCGNEATFIECKDYFFDSWYYMMISWFSYSNPTFNISDLHMQLSEKKFLALFENYLLDKIILNIFEFDIHEVIKDSTTLLKNQFFSAHLLDILYLNGKLQLNNRDSANKLYEQSLADYGTALLSYPDLWLIGCDYLLQCQDYINGIEVIESYIQAIPISNEDDAKNLFDIAYKFGLQEQAYSIGRVIQMKLLQQGNFKNSLNWCIRIKDASFGTLLADRITEEFIQTNDKKVLELFDNLVTETVTFSDRLVFLSKYQEYLKCMYLKKHKDAAIILTQLLSEQQLIPTKYKEYIILEIADLLPEYKLNEEQIFIVLKAIQNHTNRVKTFKESTFKPGKDSNVQTNLEIIQIQDEKNTRLLNISKDLTKQLADIYVFNSIEVHN